MAVLCARPVSPDGRAVWRVVEVVAGPDLLAYRLGQDPVTGEGGDGVAGDGPDLGELKRRCGAFSNVRFLGCVPHERVPEIVAQADVYVFPSRYEGFGLSLVEAMASGCVPVASLIKGVTDSIVEHGKTGYLFPIGDWHEAAERIVQLARDQAKVEGMSAAARQSVRSTFSIETAAKQYVMLIDRVLATPRPLRPVLDLRHWSYPRGLKPGLRTYLPESIKKHLRALREVIAH